MDLDAVAVLGAGSFELEFGVDQVCRPQLGGAGGQHVAAADLADRDPGQIDRHPLSGGDVLERLVVDLHRADTDTAPRGQQLECIAARDRSGPQGPGHYRARAANRERSVDVQARSARRLRATANRRHELLERGAQVREALAGLGYGPDEVRDALATLPDDGPVEQLLRDALRRLAVSRV